MVAGLKAGIRRHIFLILSLAVAGMTGVLVHAYLAGFAETVPVVVAARDLAAPMRLTAEDLRLVPVPAQSVHPQSVHDPRALVGRFLRAPAVSGQVLLLPHVDGGSGLGSPLQVGLGPGQVAFFLPTGLDRGLGGALEAGDRVDVVFVGQEGRFGTAVAQTLVIGVPVLDVRDQGGESLAAIGGGGRSLPAGVVVAVSSRDAERLAFALEHGRIYLTLRSELEGVDLAWGAGVTWDSLLYPGGVPQAGDEPAESQPDLGGERR